MHIKKPFKKNKELKDRIETWYERGERIPFYNRAEKWINQFPNELKVTMLKLLANFTYYNEKSVKEQITNLFNLFCSNYKKDDFTYMGVEKEMVGFSQIFFTQFWASNDLYNYGITTVSGLLEEGQVPSKIAIVDDYVGTGKTIKKFIEKLIHVNNDIVSSEIVVLVLSIYSCGKRQIEDFAKLIGFRNFKILSLAYTEKAFCPDLIFSKQECSIEKNKYIKFCENIGIDKDVFGYGEVEALISFHYNTPNNTLPVFWKKLDNFVYLFKRQEKQRTHIADMQRKAEESRKRRNAEYPVTQTRDREINEFMAYCVSEGKEFCFNKCRQDLGYTYDKFDKALKESLAKKYLVYDTDKVSYVYTRFCPKKWITEFRENTRSKEPVRIEQVEVSYIPKDFEKRFGGYKSKQKEV